MEAKKNSKTFSKWFKDNKVTVVICLMALVLISIISICAITNNKNTKDNIIDNTETQTAITEVEFFDEWTPIQEQGYNFMVDAPKCMGYLGEISSCLNTLPSEYQESIKQNVEIYIQYAELKSSLGYGFPEGTNLYINKDMHVLYNADNHTMIFCLNKGMSKDVNCMTYFNMGYYIWNDLLNDEEKALIKSDFENEKYFDEFRCNPVLIKCLSSVENYYCGLILDNKI